MDHFGEFDGERIRNTVLCTAESQGIFTKALRSNAKCDCGVQSCFQLVEQLPDGLYQEKKVWHVVVVKLIEISARIRI
jgi:hypothetical protein